MGNCKTASAAALRGQMRNCNQEKKMSETFNDLLQFFGLSEMPLNLGEMLPWLFSVMLAVSFVFLIFGMIGQIVRSVGK